MKINLESAEKKTLLHVARTKFQKQTEWWAFRKISIPMYVSNVEDNNLLFHRAHVGLFSDFAKYGNETFSISFNEIATIKKRGIPFEFLKGGKHKLNRYILTLKNQEIIHLLIYEDQLENSNKKNKFGYNVTTSLDLQIKNNLNK